MLASAFDLKVFFSVEQARQARQPFAVLRPLGRSLLERLGLLVGGGAGTVAVANDLRDKIANFDDFFRPLRNYFYWEPNCFDIPIDLHVIEGRRFRRRPWGTRDRSGNASLRGHSRIRGSLYCSKPIGHQGDLAGCGQ